MKPTFKKTCCECHQEKLLTDFSITQRKRPDSKRRCIQCIEEDKKAELQREQENRDYQEWVDDCALYYGCDPDDMILISEEN